MRALPPDFRTLEFARGHALATLAFHDGRCIDDDGGFFHFLRDDGSVADPHTRHLASSAGYVVLFAQALRRFPGHERAGAWREAVEHGIRFIQQVHFDPSSGVHARELRFDEGRKTVLDDKRRSSCLAWVMRAHAEATLSGIDAARDGVAMAFAALERWFWEPRHGLYASAMGADGGLSPRRSASANMHACEALLAAHRATGEEAYLLRAASVAEAVVLRVASVDGLPVWEHHDVDWQPDPGTGDSQHPGGHQVGHLLKWSRLLLTLERQLPDLDDENWLQHRARQLFAAAVDHGWDRAHGGLYRGFARNGAVHDDDKLASVAASGIGAAAALAERTVEGGYWDWYDRLWAHAWGHFVDHVHGGWFHRLKADHSRIDALKTAAGKVDEETLGACYEAMDAMEGVPA